MATLLVHYCMKYNKRHLLFFAIPLGFAADFAIMYPILKLVS